MLDGGRLCDAQACGLWAFSIGELAPACQAGSNNLASLCPHYSTLRAAGFQPVALIAPNRAMLRPMASLNGCKAPSSANYGASSSGDAS
jgi:hypothetical protein